MFKIIELYDHLHNADNDHVFRSRGTKKSVYNDQPRPTAYVPHYHSAGQTVALVASRPNCNRLVHIQLRLTVDTHYGHMYTH